MDSLNVNLIDYSRMMVREIDPQTIADLKDSFKQYGVLQPIVVFRNEHDRWEVICGNHRLCAARGVGFEVIPVVIRKCSPSEAMLLGLIENIQRFEMDPIREGQIYHDMIQNNAYTSESIGQKVSKGKVYVENRIRIFKNLHPKLKLELGKTLNIVNASALAKLSQNEQLVVFSRMKAVVIPKPQSSPSLIGGIDSGWIPTPYCVCEKCGSKHLQGVSIGADERRAETILSKMQE